MDAVYFNGQCAVPQSDANRPKSSDSLELEGRVARVALEQRKIGISQLPN
jgi:hypothetical protein